MAGWRVIIGLRGRVSGGGIGGNEGGVVQKCPGLWRTCGMRDLLRDSVGFAGVGVEIFCSTWNVFEDVTVIKRIKTG